MLLMGHLILMNEYSTLELPGFANGLEPRNNLGGKGSEQRGSCGVRGRSPEVWMLWELPRRHLDTTKQMRCSRCEHWAVAQWSKLDACQKHEPRAFEPGRQ